MSNTKNQQNENQDNINSKDFLIGALVGGIAGAALALVFAPKSGKELRGDINQGASYVKDRASEWKEVAAVKGSEWMDKAKHQTQQISETVSQKSQDLTQKIKETKDNLQTKMAGNEDPEKAAEEVARAIEEAALEVEQDNSNN